ncbi:MAG: AraC family transcriptional regulator [Fermentimonas sp.]|nr:AraC family transcriptional regulator [Fermentimonas sp.]
MVQQFFTALPLFVVLFWLILFLLDYKNSNTPKRFLIFFLGIALLNYLAHWNYFNHNYAVYNILDSVWVFTTLAVYPVYYYYIRLLTVDLKINLRWIWILIPAILLSIFSAVLYLLMSPEEISVFTHQVLYNNSDNISEFSLLINLQILRINLLRIIFTIEVVLTLYFGLRLIKNFNEKVRYYYSNIENKELSKIKMLLYFFVFTSLISIISNLIGKSYFADHSYLIILPSIAHAAAFFGICYVGYRQGFTIHDLKIEKQVETTVETELNDEVFSSNEFDKLFTRLEALFDEKQIFKDADLRLNDVASQLGTNRTYVSKLINTRRGMNFNDFVNDYRVHYSEMILSSSEYFSLSLEEIALKSGFSNTSSFYRSFVKKNGLPPGKFREKKGE